jgi:hypothetical protein
MIQFEVTDCPDSQVMAPFTFYQNQIYLGKSKGDLWINDPSLLANHAMVEVVERDLLFHPQKGVEFYHLNGKRSSTVRKIKIGDIITIGKTKIKILDFQETRRESKKVILNNKLSKLIAENSLRLTVIERLSRLMK